MPYFGLKLKQLQFRIKNNYSMDIKEAYNIWAEQYDTNDNKTRDLEAIALRNTLSNYSFSNCLEVGCGTGKNTVWLIQRAQHVTAIDLSSEMLAKAKEKIQNDKATFHQADIKAEWTFLNTLYNLITFSLVLEHIDDLDHVFKQASKYLSDDGHVYIGELHPFKQYTGTKARFENDKGRHIVECFNHNISDFVQSAKRNNLSLVDINEFFDDDNRTTIPRIITIILKKNSA